MASADVLASVERKARNDSKEHSMRGSVNLSSTAGPLLPQRKLAESGHLPSLDGLRTVSISLVVLSHLSGTRGFVRLNLGIGDYGRLRVVVFS